MLEYNYSYFTVTSLSLALMLSSSCFALEKLNEEALAQSTGEGIGFAINDFSFQLNGTDNSQGTGYIRLIPVGAQSQKVINHNNSSANATGSQAEQDRAKYDTDIGKGDIYLYGLAVSANDSNANTQFSGDNVNIGSYENSWLIKAASENVSNYAGVVKPISYVLIEAPALNYQTDAYNLKFGFWTDALVRDATVEEGNSQQFQLNGATRSGTTYVDSNNDGTYEQASVDGQTRENRLRLQVVLNGASINGSSVKLFQTSDGASNSNGMSADYNDTLGMASALRLNTGDSSNIRANTANLDEHVFRISTQETTATDLMRTPALNGGATPNFSASEGLYMYSPNFNIILGTLWQPLTFSVAEDNKNIVIELARVSNSPAVYNEVYEDYFGNNGALKGGTCNLYWCGDSNKNATHSSITIGSTEAYETAGSGRVSAYKGTDAVGVSFGSMNTTNTNNVNTASFTNLGSASIDGVLIQHLKITTKGL